MRCEWLPPHSRHFVPRKRFSLLHRRGDWWAICHARVCWWREKSQSLPTRELHLHFPTCAYSHYTDRVIPVFWITQFLMWILQTLLDLYVWVGVDMWEQYSYFNLEADTLEILMFWQLRKVLPIPEECRFIHNCGISFHLVSYFISFFGYKNSWFAVSWFFSILGKYWGDSGKQWSPCCPLNQQLKEISRWSTPIIICAAYT